MAAYTSSGNGNWDNAATWGGVGTPATGDTAAILNTHTVTVVQSEACLSVDVQAGGTLVLDATGNAVNIVFTWDDTAGCGFGASAGAIQCLGDATWSVTLNSAGGTTPTNYWDFRANFSDITANYTTFEGFNYFLLIAAACNIAIDYCTFQYNDSTRGEAVRFDGGLGSVIMSFTNNTIDNCGGTDSVFRCGIDHSSFDNIVITNIQDGVDVMAWTGTELHFVNSNFDLANCAVGAGDSLITSEDHNDVAGYYGVVLRDSDTVDFSQINTEPDATDIMYFFLEVGATSSTFDFDEVNKTVAGIVINPGEAITLTMSAATTTVNGSITGLYIWNVAANTTVDASAATGAGANIQIEFQSRVGALLNNSAGILLLQGDPTHYIKISENGVADTTTPTKGINITAITSLRMLVNIYFFHINAGEMANVFGGGTLEMDNASIWFAVGTAPEEVGLTGPLAFSMNNSLIGSYDNKEWYINSNTLTDPTANFSIAQSKFINILQAIYEPSDDPTSGVVFFQQPQTCRAVYPSIMMSAQAGEYDGGVDVPIERTHESDLMVKMSGWITSEIQAPFGWLEGHPQGHLYYIDKCYEYYDDEQTDLVFWFKDGQLNSAQITELKPDRPTGNVDEYVPVPYSMVIEGEAIVAPPA